MPSLMPNALDMLLSRASSGELRDPAPSGRDLELIAEAGLRAPDHGKLRPWRFIAITRDAAPASPTLP